MARGTVMLLLFVMKSSCGRVTVLGNQTWEKETGGCWERLGVGSIIQRWGLVGTALALAWVMESSCGRVLGIKDGHRVGWLFG